MIIDTHAHVVPATLLDAMRGQPRLFPSVTLHDAAAPRMAFASAGRGGRSSRGCTIWPSAATG